MLRTIGLRGGQNIKTLTFQQCNFLIRSWGYYACKDWYFLSFSRLLPTVTLGGLSLQIEVNHTTQVRLMTSDQILNFIHVPSLRSAPCQPYEPVLLAAEQENDSSPIVADKNFSFPCISTDQTRSLFFLDTAYSSSPGSPRALIIQRGPTGRRSEGTKSHLAAQARGAAMGFSSPFFPSIHLLPQDWPRHSGGE